VSERLLTLAEAAERLGYSARTVRRRIERGELPVFRDGRILRICESDLLAYIARRTTRLQLLQRRTVRLPHRREPSGVRNLFELPDPLVDPPARSI
jgi:excisionase family DNA binding protein